MKKLKIIVVILLGILLVGGISAYATYTYMAKDVEYTKSNGTKVSVESALNELYSSIGTKTYIYNQQVDNLSNHVDGGYSGFLGTFSDETYNGLACKYQYFTEDHSAWSCGVKYYTDEINISQNKTLTINYAKIYSSGSYITHFVAFLDENNNTVDVISISDKAIDEENKTATIDLSLINPSAKKIAIGVQSGVAKDNIYNCFVLGRNDYKNEYNGTGYEYIKEVYFTK